MKITLKNVKYSAALSEETAAFLATICIDGVPAFITGNHGTGGCNEIHPIKGQTYEQARAAKKRLDEYAKTLPKIVCPDSKRGDGKPFEYEQSAETMVGDALDEWQRMKEVRRYAAQTRDRVVSISRAGELFTSNKAPAGKLGQWIAMTLKNHPDRVIVNHLRPEDQIAAISGVLL